MQRKLRIWSSFSCSDNRKFGNPKSKMAGAIVIFVLVVLGLWSGAAADENSEDRVARWPFSGRPGGGGESFRRALRALGYVEGKNIAFEYR